MRIESEVFQFHPSCQFEKLQLDDLQKQYLTDLRNQNSIQALTERYLANGWLVNFKLLYDLIHMLVTHHWVLNPVIISYFRGLHLQVQSEAQGAFTSQAENSYRQEDLLALPFFRSLQPELSAFLLKSSMVSRYPAQSLICKTSDASRDLYVLLKGELGVYTQATTFKQFISLLPEGSVFGEAGFLLGQKRTADVVAMKTSEVLVVPYQAEVLDRFLNTEKAQSLQQRFWVQHALLHSDFFKTTPADCLDALTFSGQIIDLRDQQVLFTEGELSDSAYIVIQGSLLVTQKGQIINTLSQGAFLGEISLMMNDGRRTATVMAQRNAKVLKIGRAEFYRLLARNLYLAKEFQSLADQRLKKDIQRHKPN